MTTYSRRRFLGMAGIVGTGLCLGLPVRAQAAQVTTETRMMLGTFVGISLAGVSRMQAEEAFGRAFAEAARLEGLFNRHASGTAISELNRVGQLSDAPQELTLVLSHAKQYGALTAGAFDVTVQPMVDLLRTHQNPEGEMRIDPVAFQAARDLIDADAVHVSADRVVLDREGMGVTLDGLAKGYIADRISATLTACGAGDHLVNAGGDIVAKGCKAPGTAWRVAVESPSHKGKYPTVLPLTNQAIATSGGYETYYDATQRHHHLITPSSGASPFAVRSASVVAPTAMEADALATALTVMPPQEGLNLIKTLPSRACFLLTALGQMATHCPA
ncbi:MAG: FAD:protein FMN transferase [Bilophila sp.]